MPIYTNKVAVGGFSGGGRSTTVLTPSAGGIVACLSDALDTTYGREAASGLPADFEVGGWPVLAAGERVVSVVPYVRSKSPGPKVVSVNVGSFSYPYGFIVTEGAALALPAGSAVIANYQIQPQLGQLLVPTDGSEWRGELLHSVALVSRPQHLCQPGVHLRGRCLRLHAQGRDDRRAELADGHGHHHPAPDADRDRVGRGRVLAAHRRRHGVPHDRPRRDEHLPLRRRRRGDLAAGRHAPGVECSGAVYHRHLRRRRDAVEPGRLAALPAVARQRHLRALRAGRARSSERRRRLVGLPALSVDPERGRAGGADGLADRRHAEPAHRDRRHGHRAGRLRLHHGADGRAAPRGRRSGAPCAP